MADQEGGRWDVGAKGNTVLVARISDDNETLFKDRIAPEEARKLAELLTKFASKADDADGRDSDEDSDDDEDISDEDRDDEDEDEDSDEDSSDDKSGDKKS